MLKKMILTITILLLCINAVSADTVVEPLSGFNVLIPIDDSMVAGEERCALFEFNANYDATIVINFTIEHPDICSGEWYTTMLLNEEVFSNETAPGVFSTGEIEITKGYYAVGVCYTSNSAIVPDNYNFSLEILSEDIVLSSSKKSRGGGGSNTWPIITPTPTPNQTAVVYEGSTTITPTPTPINITAEQIQEPSRFSWWIIIAIILLLLALILAGLKKRRKNKDNQP